MRIFKNRGDIYFSKINKKKSNEQKILLTALTAIIVFTIAFLIFVGVKNDFSAKKFFAPDEIKTVQNAQTQPFEELPQVSGKTNFILLVNSGEELLYVQLVQVDMDNTSYKVAALKADTEADGVSFSKIFKQSGAENVKKAAELLLSTEIDYYIQMENKDYSDFFDELGAVNYPVLADIKFKSSNGDSGYSLKLKAGEQRLKGAQVVNLVRYYLEEENNTSAANDLMLNCLNQQINSKNLEKSDRLFNSFIAYANTNITVRNYSMAGDNLAVLANDNTGAGVYSAAALYDGNSIEQESLQKLKGYFVK